MNKRIILFSLLFIAAHVTTKAQMTIGGSYKPSHTLVVKGQVKIDTVKAGSLTDFLISIGDDSVLHRLPISGLINASQTNISAGTNVTITGTGSAATPYVISSPTTNALTGTANNLISTVNGTAAGTTLVRSINNASSTNTLTTTVNGVSASGVNIINANTSSLSQAGGLVNTVNGVAATTAIPTGTVSNVLGYSSTGTPVYQSASTVLSGATTNTLGVSGNTLTSTVNGASATAPLIGTVSNTSTANTISTSINGQSGSSVNIINSNTNNLSQTTGLVTTVNGVAATTSIPTGTVANVLGYNATGAPVFQPASTVLSGATTHTVGVSGNTLTSTVNGVAATAPLIGTVSNASTGNSITTTINGQTGSGATIINANTNALSQAAGLVNTVNGVAATTTIPTGTVSNVLGYSSTGTPVYQSASAVLSGATTNTSSLTQTGGLVTTVNGVAATTAIPTGTVTNMLGYSSAGTPVYQSPAAVLTGASTNTLTSTSGTLTSTVNGKVATAPVLISANNGLTATSGNVALGGALTAATTIAGAANKLSITSTATDGFAVDGTTLSVDAVNHRVGFGTNAPGTTIDVRGATAGTALRMADGTQAADKVLTSDANGNATWNTIPGNTAAVMGNLSSATNTLPSLSDSYTGTTITLPPGKWAISMIFLIRLSLALNNPLPSGYSRWIRTTLTNSTTSSTSTPDIVGSTNLCSGSITGPANYGLVNGIIIINNATAASKTYYLWVKAGEAQGLLSGNDILQNFGTSLWSEDQIIAMPIK